ncbi:MAG TPA: glycosyltransferase [Leifsonia sp.]|jgi:glycosyltransferase involved in cell wall biosynthesis
MPRFGILTTFAPTRCGIATFSAALGAALADEPDGAFEVVRLLERGEADGWGERPFDPRISVDMVAGDSRGRSLAVDALDWCDVVIVQHEYGIYGGSDGDEVLHVLESLSAPAIVVLHTVLRSPTPGQRMVLERICALAGAVVVMTGTAARLLGGYAVPMEKVRVIPHGVAPRPTTSILHTARPQVLTWGLIGPGKGIEWAIRAMAQLADMSAAPTYSVLGQTHPKVLAKHGERYRESLNALIGRLGLTQSVRLDGRYLEPDELATAIAAADVVLLPYDSRDQVTSGVLVEAIAAGIPVVATAFPHAEELLETGPGIVVAHEDPTAIADAVRSILTEQGLADRMRLAASMATAETTWADVALRYRELATELLHPVAV